MKSAVAIRHVAFEGLDGFEPPLREAGYAIDYVDACDSHLPLDRLARADLLVVLGGPISAYESDVYPFLDSEIEAIRRRLNDGTPLIGICLGAQLIALAAGARVYPSGIKEIGIAPVSLSDAGRESCLHPFAKAPPTLHWHGDTFDLPDGAVHLASTERCENQAFAIGRNVIGFQFHPEATGRNIEHWLVGHAAELGAAGIDVPQLRADARRHGTAFEAKARATLSHWLARIQG